MSADLPEIADSYKFSTADSPQNILATESDGRVLIKGASLLKIVEKLTSNACLRLEPTFQENVFLTMRTMTTPHYFLDLLVHRYAVPHQSKLDAEEYLQKVMAIRLRVLKLIKYWVDTFWNDYFATDENLRLKLKKFLKERTVEDYVATHVEALRRNISEQHERSETLVKTIDLTTPSSTAHSLARLARLPRQPAASLPPNAKPPTALLSFTPVELANTVATRHLRAWRTVSLPLNAKPDAALVAAAFHAHDDADVLNLASTSPSPSKALPMGIRACAAEYWHTRSTIQCEAEMFAALGGDDARSFVSLMCQTTILLGEMGCYPAAFAVVGALYAKLSKKQAKAAWKGIKSKTEQQVADIAALAQPRKNWKDLKALTEDNKERVAEVPWLPCLTSWLAAANAARPDFLADGGGDIIDVEKRVGMSTLLRYALKTQERAAQCTLPLSTLCEAYFEAEPGNGVERAQTVLAAGKRRDSVTASGSGEKQRSDSDADRAELQLLTGGGDTSSGGSRRRRRKKDKTALSRVSTDTPGSPLRTMSTSPGAHRDGSESSDEASGDMSARGDTPPTDRRLAQSMAVPRSKSPAQASNLAMSSGGIPLSASRRSFGGLVRSLKTRSGRSRSHSSAPSPSQDDASQSGGSAPNSPGGSRLGGLRGANGVDLAGNMEVEEHQGDAGDDDSSSDSDADNANNSPRLRTFSQRAAARKSASSTARAQSLYGQFAAAMNSDEPDKAAREVLLSALRHAPAVRARILQEVSARTPAALPPPLLPNDANHVAKLAAMLAGTALGRAATQVASDQTARLGAVLTHTRIRSNTLSSVAAHAASPPQSPNAPHQRRRRTAVTFSYPPRQTLSAAMLDARQTKTERSSSESGSRPVKSKNRLTRSTESHISEASSPHVAGAPLSARHQAGTSSLAASTSAAPSDDDDEPPSTAPPTAVDERGTSLAASDADVPPPESSSEAVPAGALRRRRSRPRDTSDSSGVDPASASKRTDDDTHDDDDDDDDAVDAVKTQQRGAAELIDPRLIKALQYAFPNRVLNVDNFDDEKGLIYGWPSKLTWNTLTVKVDSPTDSSSPMPSPHTPPPASPTKLLSKGSTRSKVTRTLAQNACRLVLDGRSAALAADDSDAPLLLEVLEACEPADLATFLRKCRVHRRSLPAFDESAPYTVGVLCARIIDDQLVARAVANSIRVIAY